MRVVLADDHRMLRDGLRALLERAGVEVVGEAATGHEALTEVRRLRPDVVIMDIGMPELNGIDATKRLMAELHGLKVLALSMNGVRRAARRSVGGDARRDVPQSSDRRERCRNGHSWRHRRSTQPGPAAEREGARGAAAGR